MVLLGAVVMAAGHFTLGFHDAFFVGLLLIIVGNGCFKPNISVQIGRLYVDEDPRKIGVMAACTRGHLFSCGFLEAAVLQAIYPGASALPDHSRGHLQMCARLEERQSWSISVDGEADLGA